MGDACKREPLKGAQETRLRRVQRPSLGRIRRSAEGRAQPRTTSGSGPARATLGIPEVLEPLLLQDQPGCVSAPTPLPPSARLHTLPRTLPTLLAAWRPTNRPREPHGPAAPRKDSDPPPRGLRTGSFRRLRPSPRVRPPHALDSPRTRAKRWRKQVSGASASLWRRSIPNVKRGQDSVCWRGPPANVVPGTLGDTGLL